MLLFLTHHFSPPNYILIIIISFCCFFIFTLSYIFVTIEKAVNSFLGGNNEKETFYMYYIIDFFSFSNDRM